MRAAWIAAIAAVLLAGMVRRQIDATDGEGGELVPLLPDVEDIVDTLDDGFNAIIPVRSLMWSPEKVPPVYRAAIAGAETANGIPSGMLARLLYQESRYRPDIISGRTRSRAGAIGIAQFMPATAAEWGVDPFDPFSSIDGAGRYLAWLHRRVGSWAGALAAYNWGIGNVMKKGLSSAPVETQNYFGQILADLGLDGGTVA